MIRQRARRRPVVVALLAMLLGGVGAGTATVLAQQSTGDAGPHRAASAPERTPTTTSSPVTTTAKPTPSTTRKPTRSKRPKPTRQTTSERPEPTTTTPKPKPEPQPRTPTSAVQAVVNLVNDARADAGCDPVRADERLNAAAGKHSADMAARDYFSHDTPEGEDFAERIRAEGYPRPGAENIAQGQRSAADVMDAWMSSEGHRANILNCELTAIGVGLAQGDWVWTQDFGY